MTISAFLASLAAARRAGNGAEANARLAALDPATLTGSAQDWQAVVEESIASGLFAKAEKLCAALRASSSELADFLQLLLARECEDWNAFDTLVARLGTARGETALRVQIQRVRALLRLGRLEAAEKVAQAFVDRDHPLVALCLARLQLARGNKQAALSLCTAPACSVQNEVETLALRALATENPQQAEQYYCTALAMQPNQAETHSNLAALYAQQNRLDKADQHIKASLAIKPWIDAPLLLLITLMVRQHRYNDARTILEQQLKRHQSPQRLGAWLDLLRMTGEKKNRLVEATTQCLEQYPQDALLLLSAGAAYQASGKRDEAIACYEHRLRLLPQDAATMNNLAQLYRDQGDMEQAIALWRSLTQPQKHADDTILGNLAQALLARGDTREAEDIFQAMHQRQPENPLVLRGLASLAAAGGDYEQGWIFAKQALERDATHSRSWLLATSILIGAGNLRAAESLLRQGAEKLPNPLPIQKELISFWLADGREDEALEALRQWRERTPDEAFFLLREADILYEKSNFNGALAAIQHAEQLDWEEGGAALVRYHEMRTDFPAALTQARAMLEKNPRLMRHYGLVSQVLYRQKHVEEALATLDRALAQAPGDMPIMRQKLGQLLAQEHFAEAVPVAQALVRDKCIPPHVDLLLEAWQRGHQPAEAIAFCRQLCAQEPHNLPWLLRLAQCLAADRQTDEALATLEQACALEPQNMRAGTALITLYMRAERYDDAHAKVLQLRDISTQIGERPDTLIALAEILQKMGRTDEACRLLDDATARFPRYLPLHWKQADVLRRAGLPDKELATVRRILSSFPPEQVVSSAIDPLLRLAGLKEQDGHIDIDSEGLSDLMDAIRLWIVKAPHAPGPLWAQFSVAMRLKKYTDALACLDKLEARDPDSSRVLQSRAQTLSELWKLSEALECQRKACALRPDSAPLHEALLNLLVKAGNYDEFESLLAYVHHLRGDAKYAHYIDLLFNINCHPTWSAAQVYAFFRDWYEKAVYPHRPPLRPYKNTRDPERKLKIGYVSPDFRRHAMAYYSEPLLIEHDREQFELYAFANLENNAADAYTERFKSYVDHWHDVTHIPDDELEKLIRDKEIDILIDLAGHTANNRLNVFLRRPAPVQASWIYGYIQTSGLREVDYLLCDGVEVPPEHEAFVAEPHVLRLSFGGHPFKPAHDALEPEPLPFRANGFVTFGVSTRPVRVNRQVVAAWARILQRLPTARIAFSNRPYEEVSVQEHIAAQFAEHGIKRDQLLFRNTRPAWAAYSAFDLQLDCFPVGSGTTLSEGLWMERVSVCLAARPPMGRVAYGTQKTLGLGDWVCADTVDAYIDKAVFLGAHPDTLEKISQGLRQKMQQSKLMDYKNYSRETAIMYRTMWRNFCAEEHPDA